VLYDLKKENTNYKSMVRETTDFEHYFLATNVIYCTCKKLLTVTG
jgi:hypothetical protein